MNTRFISIPTSLLLLVAPSLLACGQEVAVDLQVTNPHVLIGEPLRVEITIRNMSEKPIRISLTASSQYGNAPNSYLVVSSGKVIQCGSNGFGYSRTADFPLPNVPGEPIDTPPGKSIRFVDTLICGNSSTVIAGDYEIFTKFVGPGRTNLNIIENQPPKYFCEGCWKGIVESPRIKTHFDELSKMEGEALAIYNNSSDVGHFARLLNKYPTSKFSAYVIFQQCSQFPTNDFMYIVDSLASGRPIEGSTNVPDDTLTDKLDPNHWKHVTYKNAAEWRKKWINIAIRNHPDIWFADDLRLQLAVDQILLKNYQSGTADLEKLAKDPKCRISKKAGEYLTLLREKKLIQ